MNLDDIKIGYQYLFENDSYCTKNVTILKDLSTNEYYEFIIRTDDWIAGTSIPQNQGDISQVRIWKKDINSSLKMSFKFIGNKLK